MESILTRRPTAILYRRINLENYLVGSTVLCTFLFIRIAHVAIDIFLGYLIIVFNTVILLALDRLLIHRNHAILIGILTFISMLASARAGTPTMSIIAQLVGICGFSIYFFSMLTTSGVSTARWMEMYALGAVFVTIYGLILYVANHTVLPSLHDPRLHSIYEEPSFFIYLTLPALGFYATEWVRARRYGLETSIFIIAYILADSSLGFLGLLLVAFFALLPKLNFGRLLAFIFAACAAAVALFFTSVNVRIRVVDTVVALTNADLSNVNATTFGILTNGYVTLRTFLDHPLIGVGLGGYQFAYLRYISGLSGLDPDLISLNMYDASSLFFRTTAELGVFGVVCLLGFFIGCSRVRGTQFVEMRNALLPYLIVRMTRYGAYFSCELYFFCGLFVLNYLESRGRQSPPRRVDVPVSTGAE